MQFVFDVDGTLTESLKPIDDDFESTFYEFCCHYKVIIVSGSDYEKIKKQLSERILHAAHYVFTCSGNESHRKGMLVSTIKNEMPDELNHSLMFLLAQSKSPIKTSNHIEIRNGCVNFSIPGRDCTFEERAAYVEWDNEHKERQNIAEQLSLYYKELQFDLGGQISIDIYPKGRGKEQIVGYLGDTDTIWFFGDKIQPNGNDNRLAQALLNRGNSVICSVKHWTQTEEILEQVK